MSLCPGRSGHWSGGNRTVQTKAESKEIRIYMHKTINTSCCWTKSCKWPLEAGGAWGTGLHRRRSKAAGSGKAGEEQLFRWSDSGHPEGGQV